MLVLPVAARAECSGGSTPTGEVCGKIGIEGCCEGETLYFCEGGEKCLLPCEKIPLCGWNPAKAFYDCETTGGEDPELLFFKECPLPLPAVCNGVDYRGCCAGDKAYWCDGQSLNSLDCSKNPELNHCGLNADKGVADCVGPDVPSFESCPFVEGDVITEHDTTGGDLSDSASQKEVLLSLDGLEVPDMNAPSSCTALAAKYDVHSTDCPQFGSHFLVLQDGCAALLAGLVPSSPDHPAAKVTKSGLAFDYHNLGKQLHCTGTLDGDTAIEGECNDGEATCTFRFVAVEKPPLDDGGNGGYGGGCVVSRIPAGSVVLQVLLLLLIIGLTVRSGRAR